MSFVPCLPTEIVGDVIEQKLQSNGLVRKLIPLDAKPEEGEIYTKIYMRSVGGSYGLDQ